MPRFLLVLLVLFIGSGCSALIYEIVWLQLLQLVIGSSGVSMAVLLGTFMGGMCLGSLLLPRWIDFRRHPLRVYALLELGTGLFGVLVLFGLPALQQIYLTGMGHGMAGILWRGLICAVCLLPPTMFMGATLPAMSRWLENTPEAWGVFYGGNIAGGVLGCVLAGFYLLRLYDMATASFFAVTINVAVAAVAWLVAAKASYQPAAVPTQNGRAPGHTAVYIAIGLSGLCALGAEVVWTRLLSLMLGPTVYTFSIILGVFLTGLGIGSGAGSWIARKARDPSAALSACQLLLALTIAWAAFQLADALPYWPGNLMSTRGPWHGFINDILRCACGIFPAAVLWGASFPLALAAVARKDQDPGRIVGEVYAANTLGAIAGAIGFSILSIPLLGSQQSERVLIVLSALAALFAASKANFRWTAPAALAVALLVWTVPPIPWKLIGFGRRLPSTTGRWDLLYVGEGINSAVAYSNWDGIRPYFHVSGKVEASAEPQDMRLQRLLGHLPALLHPHPRSILVVGCGAGVTAGTFVVHPEVEHITICEIEPLIPPHSAQFFAEQNHNVVHDPRTSIVYDDARHYVLTTPVKYDIITSDPIHPWVKGIAPLYSTEYFEMCKRHLNPGGLVTQWVPLYESNLETVRSEIATFFEVFPNGSIWGNLDQNGRGYDLVMLGSVNKLTINANDLQHRLDRPDYAPVRRSLYEVGFGSAMQLLATYTVEASDLRGWLENSQINRDRNLRLQYLAGLGLNVDLGGPIYDDIISHARFPAPIFESAGGGDKMTR